MSDFGPDTVLEHLGGMTFAESEEEIACTITRGDLYRLDQIITLFDVLAEHFSCDFYDDAWNLRNHLVPFKPGDEHYDDERDRWLGAAAADSQPAIVDGPGGPEFSEPLP